VNLLLDFLINGAFLFDALGVVGLGMVGLAAMRLSHRYRSWGGSLLACGSLLLLLGRIWFLASEHVVTHDMKHSIGEAWGTALGNVPMALLTVGVAFVVWGLWGHEQWLREER
jgi:hypothetical protein